MGMADENLKQRVGTIVSLIPAGRITSYGEIAKQAGYKNHARYVGTLLKQLPEDTRLPWHRVVNAKGEIAFAKNSPAYEKQRALLEAEGVIFKQGKISLKAYGWKS